MIWQIYNYKKDAQDAAAKYRAEGKRVRVRKRKAGEYEVRSVAKKRNPSKRKTRKRVGAALRKFVRGNPSVKGRKVKGGRAVTLKNFTGTVVRKSNGQVLIQGRGRR